MARRSSRGTRFSPRPDLGYVYGPDGRRLAGTGGPMFEAPPAAAVETVTAPVLEEPITHDQEEPPMPTADRPSVIATTSQDQALATVPRGLEEMFSAEEWALMPPEERAAAVAFFREEQRETTDGLDITFPRVPYPTSGSSFWEVPTASGEPEARKTLEGIVVYKQPTRAYWPLDAEVSKKNPPTCSSPDGITPLEGEGKQAKTCGICPHARFGTGRDGHGQACKARLQTFVLMGDEEIPTLVSLPPSALKTFSDYAVQLRKANSALLAVTTVFGLTDERSNAGISYKALTLKIGRKLTYAEMVRARKIRELFEAQMAKRGLQVDDETSSGGGPVIDGEARRVVDDGRPLAEQLTGRPERVPF
jgi:hypothetical protein